MPPRRLVIASRVDGGLYSTHAQRYRGILARDGVTLEIRPSAAAAQKLALLLDPGADVDIAFVRHGLAHTVDAQRLEMLAAPYDEVLRIFTRPDATFVRRRVR